MAQIILDTDKITALFLQSVDGGINPEAESAIIEVLDLQDKLNSFVATLAEEIEKKSLEYNQFWSGSRGSKVAIEYRAYGAIYSAKDFDKVGDEFKTKKVIPETVKYSLNTETIEKYVLENKATPEGITENVRTKQVSIKRLK